MQRGVGGCSGAWEVCGKCGCGGEAIISGHAANDVVVCGSIVDVWGCAEPTMMQGLPGAHSVLGKFLQHLHDQIFGITGNVNPSTISEGWPMDKLNEFEEFRSC